MQSSAQIQPEHKHRSVIETEMYGNAFVDGKWECYGWLAEVVDAEQEINNERNELQNEIFIERIERTRPSSRTQPLTRAYASRSPSLSPVFFLALSSSK